MIALVLALGLERGEVGARPRLGITLAPPNIAARDLRQKALLLFLITVFEQGRPEHRDPEAVQGIARIDPSHLLTEDLGLGRREATPTIFTRPVRHGPAARSHDVHPSFLRLVLEL